MKDYPEIQQTHLTDAQFADLLLGVEPAAVQSHLKACAHCAAEAARVSSAIADFNRQSRLWAERRAATQPVLSPASAFGWTSRTQAWSTAAAALVLAAALGLTLGRNHIGSSHTAQASASSAALAQSTSPQPAPAFPVPTSQISPSTLKSDNELLSAIDGELREDESAPSIAYSLSSAPRADRTRSARRAISE